MRRLAFLTALILPGCALQSGPVGPTITPAGDARTVWLADHNRQRAAFGSAPLVWDEDLARQAYVRAQQLALQGRLEHTPRAQRPGQGENLWLGSRGSFRAACMTGTWAAEKRHFRRGIFPNVSRTGDWKHVGHYTQMVWPTTTRVGCGLASSPRWDVLVCRYSPPGNRDGVRI
jgi:hypothetical protein